MAVRDRTPYAIIAVLFWALSPVAASEGVLLSPEARALIEPVFTAFKDIDMKLAALPAPRTDAERLVRLGQIDEAGRSAYSKIDFAQLPDDQRTAAFDTVYTEIDKRDRQNLTSLTAMLPPEGWFPQSKYGDDAVEAAWLVLQHAVRTQPELMPTALQAMEKLLPHGEVNKHRYAMLYDRVASMQGRFQKYGSQMVCHNHRWVVYPLADADTVNERRKAMGFDNSLAEHISSFAARQCPSEWTGKLPPGVTLKGP